MGKILIVLVMTISFNLFSQKVVCHPVNFKDECVLAERVLKEFVCDSNVVVIYNGLSPLDYRVEGITWMYDRYSYAINLNFSISPNIDRRMVLLHEIGHVIDLYKEDLTMFPVTWKGKTYGEDVPYRDRPWEISADEWADCLWKIFIEETK